MFLFSSCLIYLIYLFTEYECENIYFQNFINNTQDTLSVETFDDPKVKGVTLYVSNFERPLNERLQKDFFNEPSYASVTCVKTGPIEIADNISKDKSGEVSYISSVSMKMIGCHGCCPFLIFSETCALNLLIIILSSHHD